MNPLTEEFMAQFDQSYFPEMLLKEYEPVACLSEKESCETYLLESRKAGTLCIAKAYPVDLLATRESEILRSLNHPGIPRVLCDYEQNGMRFIVREYADGNTLEELTADAPMPEPMAVEVLEKLCLLVSYLHGQTPPVVHRDIKPSNLVLSGHGELSLIDFEIARRFNPNSTAGDTLLIATREYAAPEQYGYQQTDPRSDIFSMGILLAFLLTGESALKCARPRIRDNLLLRIIDKCTAFAPKDRYQTANQLHRALIGWQRRAELRWLYPAGALLLLVLLVYGGHQLSTRNAPSVISEAANTPIAQPTKTPAPVSFASPLIDHAVRASLGKLPDEPLFADEIRDVAHLYLEGDESFLTYTEYERANTHYWEQAEKDRVRGQIRPFSDIAKLTNLRDLHIANCDLDDLKPLTPLTMLETLDLMNCTIETNDFSQLVDLPSLMRLYLYKSGPADLSQLRQLTKLKEIYLGEYDADFAFLDELRDLHLLGLVRSDLALALPHMAGNRIQQLVLDNLKIDDIAALSAIQGLEKLCLINPITDSLDGIGKLPDLETLELTRSGEFDLSPLLDAPKLKHVKIDRHFRPRILALPNPLPFEVIYR